MRDLPASFATVFGSIPSDDAVVDAAATLTDGPDSVPSDVDPRAASAQGTSPRYEVKSVLGSGGMGEVRLCRDTRIGRDIAVKVAHAKLRSSSARARGSCAKRACRDSSSTRRSCRCTISRSSTTAPRTSP